MENIEFCVVVIVSVEIGFGISDTKEISSYEN